MSTTVHGFGFVGIGLAAFISLGAGPAHAAPQALALVATDGDVSLNCNGGECKAEMSAFCLQQDRLTPTRGTPYDVVDGSDLVLKGETADGRVIVLEAKKYLHFATERTHVAVRVSVSEAEMRALGIAKVRVNVGENVALLPEPTANDDRPQLEADLLLLGGPMRMLGAKLVDRNQRHMVAARLTSRIINDIPEDDRISPQQGEALWQATMREAAGQDLSAEGVGLARRAMEFCEFAVSTRARGAMRSCLQSEHDDFLSILNSNYWTAVKTGS